MVFWAQMIYDALPGSNQEAKAMFAEDFNGPSISGFKAFVNSQDPKEDYNFTLAAVCACGQYAKSIGVKDWMAQGGLWSKLNEIAAMDHDRSKWNFGALARKLEEV